MKDISIIVPIYNAEKYLKKCLDSIVNQTKKELEIILINDGSTDESETIIRKYLDDKRIKYFKNKNQGIGKTRNFGIKKATGKYLMFIDSDDYIDLNMCKEMFERCEKEKLDLVICDFYRVYDNGKKEDIKLVNFDNCSLKEKPSLINDINLSPWNKLYKTSVIKKNNIEFIENLKYEDASFVCEALKYSTKVGKINKRFNYYVIHGDSETTVRDSHVFDIIDIVDIIRKNFMKEKYMDEEVNKLTVRILTNYTIQQRYQSDKKLGKAFIDKTFDYLSDNVKDYKNNKYYLDRGIIRRNIEKSKILSNVYCKLYKG